MKLFTVWSGQYSDTRMHCVCSTKEKARQMIGNLACIDVIIDNCDTQDEIDLAIREASMNFYIEEYELDVEINFYEQGMKPMQVTRLDNGSFRVDDIYGIWEIKNCNNHKIDYTANLKVFTLHCWAKDKQHAAKIATERIAQYISTHNLEV